MAKRAWHCVTCGEKLGCRVVLYGEKVTVEHVLDGHEVHEETLCYQYGDELGHSDCPAYLPPTAACRTT